MKLSTHTDKIAQQKQGTLLSQIWQTAGWEQAVPISKQSQYEVFVAISHSKGWSYTFCTYVSGTYFVKSLKTN